MKIKSGRVGLAPPFTYYYQLKRGEFKIISFHFSFDTLMDRPRIRKGNQHCHTGRYFFSPISLTMAGSIASAQIW